ncbi:hypothetical protein NXS19_008944 [Fusarium pseudograminearum]|nr:hypothetical protein NXS19_008944 [Fusarium pseudograminearum]
MISLLIFIMFLFSYFFFFTYFCFCKCLSSTARSLVLAAGAFTALNAVGSNLILVVLVPVGQNGTNLGRVGQLVNILKVLLGQRKRLGCHVGNVLSNQLGRINRGLVDLLEQEGTERLDTRSEEG